MPKKIETEEEIITEVGTTEADDLYRVTKSFYLIIRAGPAVAIPVGSVVRLRADTARENFPARVLPANLPDPAQYEVIEKFQTADSEGLWITLNVGDVIELSLGEALPLMKGFKIKPKQIGGDKK